MNRVFTRRFMAMSENAVFPAGAKRRKSPRESARRFEASDRFAAFSAREKIYIRSIERGIITKYSDPGGAFAQRRGRIFERFRKSASALSEAGVSAASGL
jgi:hypothetical protein